MENLGANEPPQLEDPVDQVVLPNESFHGDIDLDDVFPSGANDDGPSSVEDQFHDTFHNSDEIQNEATMPAPGLDVDPEIAKETPNEATFNPPELEYAPSTPSAHNKSLDLYATPEQEEWSREAVQVRPFDLTKESDMATDDSEPIAASVSSPAKDRTGVTSVSFLNNSNTTPSVETTAAESTPEIEVNGPTESAVAELAPELDVAQPTEGMDTPEAESTTELEVNQPTEIVETVETESAPVDQPTESNPNTTSADAVNDIETKDSRSYEEMSSDLPAENNPEVEAISVVPAADEVNEVAKESEAQEDVSETSTLYEEIIEEEEGSNGNLQINHTDLYEEEIIEDEYEEEEVIEKTDSSTEEEIVDEQIEEVVEEEGVPESSTENVPPEKVDQNGDESDEVSFSSANSGGDLLSAIEEGDEHSYQSAEFSTPLPHGAQGEGENPVEVPTSFENVSGEETEERYNVAEHSEGVVAVEQSDLSTAPGAETSEGAETTPKTGNRQVYTGPVDLDDPVLVLEESSDDPDTDLDDPDIEQKQLPPGWKSRVDPVSGDTYYYNEETGETSWEMEDAWGEENKPQIQEVADKENESGGEKLLLDETMKDATKDPSESDVIVYSQDTEKEQSLVSMNNIHGDANEEADSDASSDRGNEERLKELLEDSEDENPFKSPAVLCLLCAVCLLVIAIVILIPVMLKNNDNGDNDRGISVPTRAPSPEVSTPVPTPKYELASGPFDDDPSTGFGRSISLSDGLLLIGLPSDGQGLVRSFQLNESGDLRSTGNINGEQEGSGFGWAVDVAGSVAAIGSPFLFIEDTPTQAGGVTIYEYTGSSWSQVGATLRGDEDLFAANEEFGSAVSLSVTENSYRVVVGAPISNLNDFEIGRVYTFERSVEEGSAWVGIESSALLGERAGDRFGSSVAISKDGTTFIAGGPGGDLHDDPGIVFVYEYTGGSGSAEAWELVFSIGGDEDNERFGASVAMLSDNGDTFAIGAPDYAGGSGRVVVFRKGGDGVYQQVGSDIVGERGERLGESNLLGGSASGGSVQVVVGTANGLVMRYDYSEQSRSWSKLFDEVDAGFSVVSSISVSGPNAASIAVGSEADGLVSIYNALGDITDPGPEPLPPIASPVSPPTSSPISPILPPTGTDTAAPVSETPAPSDPDTDTGAPVSETLAPTSVSLQQWTMVGGPFRVDILQSGFGSSIAMSNSQMAVGAPFTLSGSGSVHTYTEANGEWLQSDELYGEEDSGSFGFSLNLSQQGMLVGAPLVNGEGAAYYYESNNDGQLTLIGEPLRGDGAVDGAFGSSVAVSSNRVAVVGSATYSSEGLSARGGFYIFEFSDSWSSTGLEVGLEEGDSLGYAVDIDESGSILIAGAPGSNTGYASVYEKISDTWVSTLIIRGENDGDACGTSVKVLSSSYIAVGAPGYMQGRGRVTVYEKIGDSFEEMTSVVGDEGDGIGSTLQLTGSDTSLIIGTSNGTIIRLDFDGASSTWIQISETVDPGFSEGLGALASPPGDPSTFAVGGSQTALVYRISQQ